MHLYHYSLAPREEILSQQQLHDRGLVILPSERLVEEEQARRFRSEPYPAIAEISLFVDPLPLSIIRAAPFDAGHKAFKHGSTLYAHTIEATTAAILHWEFVETPLDMWLRDHLWLDWNPWKRIYFFVRHVVKSLMGYKGRDRSCMEKLICRFAGGTEEAYTSWTKSPTFLKENRMYAASVPHLLLVPKGSTGLKPIAVEKITI